MASVGQQRVEPLTAPEGAGSGGLREAFAARLDRLLDACGRRLHHPALLRRASRSRLGRPFARRSASALFDLVAGFAYTQTLLACVRLDLFEALADGARSARELAPDLGLSVERAETLLDAAAAIDLIRRRPSGRYALSMLGAAVRANPGIAAMIEHNVLLYRDLEDPLPLLRGEQGDTELARYWPYAGSAEPQALAEPGVMPYTALMAASQTLVADEILDAFPLGGRRLLMDVGGGNGTFIRAAAARAPALQFLLFDLPPVAAAARRAFAADPVPGSGAEAASARVRCEGGDFLRDPLPRGADIATLVRILHDQDDAGAVRLLRAIREALPDDGVLLVAEPMRGTPAARRIGDVYFSLYFTAMGRGRARTPDAIRALLLDAGFRSVERCATHVPLQTSLLVARC